MAIMRRLANAFRMRGAKVEQLAQRPLPQVWLISESQSPMRQFFPPAVPLRSALNRAEHAPLRVGVEDAVRLKDAQPVEFATEQRVGCGANDGDGRWAQGAPLVKQVAEHSGTDPRQEQLRTTHARGRPGGR